MSLRRIWALNLRQLYVLRRSWARVTDLFYWPVLDLLFFGFLSLYVNRLDGVPFVAGLILGALILWNVFYWVQTGISVSFLMELWTRNLLNLFATPITVPEFLVSLMLWGVIKIGITTTLVSALAYLLYQFNIFTLGLSLIPFFAALILFAWAVGMVVTAIILRFGQAAETLAWSLAFLFQPFGAVFYPLSVYPDWLVRGLVLMPLPHVFEGMRQVLGGRPLPWTNVWTAFGLDALYLLGAFIFFGYMFTLARERGLLLKAQE